LSRLPMVSISAASHTLGVNEATLRQWTDDGKVKVYITPGGHRRYAVTDLKKLLNSPTGPAALKNWRVSCRPPPACTARWATPYSARPAVWQAGCRPPNLPGEQGRQLLALIVCYASEPLHRPETLGRIRAVAAVSV